MITYTCEKCGKATTKERAIRTVKIHDGLGAGPRFELCLEHANLLLEWLQQK